MKIMPRLIGRTLTDAQSELAMAGITVDITEFGTIPPGETSYVISQTPARDTVLALPVAVELGVAIPPAGAHIVPDVLGLTMSAAEALVASIIPTLSVARDPALAPDSDLVTDDRIESVNDDVIPPSTEDPPAGRTVRAGERLIIINRPGHLPQPNNAQRNNLLAAGGGFVGGVALGVAIGKVLPQ